MPTSYSNLIFFLHKLTVIKIRLTQCNLNIILVENIKSIFLQKNQFRLSIFFRLIKIHFINLIYYTFYVYHSDGHVFFSFYLHIINEYAFLKFYTRCVLLDYYYYYILVYFMCLIFYRNMTNLFF